MRAVFLHFALVTLAVLTTGPLAAAPKVQEGVVYGEAGGQRLLLDAYQPETAGSGRPVVIFVHGGGWSAGNRKGFAHYAHDLAGRGYVCFSIEYRLVPTAIWPAQLDDCQRAVRWVRAHAKEYGLDPKRVAAVGSSAGGHLVALLGERETRDNSDPALKEFSSKVNAVVDYFGPTDLAAFPQGPRSPIVRLIGKPLPDAPEAYREASPIAFIGKDAAPMLVIHGTADTTVPIVQSERLVSGLKGAGASAELLTIDGAGHGFHNQAETPNAKKAWEAVVWFLRRTIGDRREAK